MLTVNNSRSGPPTQSTGRRRGLWGAGTRWRDGGTSRRGTNAHGAGGEWVTVFGVDNAFAMTVQNLQRTSLFAWSFTPGRVNVSKLLALLSKNSRFERDFLLWRALMRSSLSLCIQKPS